MFPPLSFRLFPPLSFRHHDVKVQFWNQSIPGVFVRPLPYQLLKLLNNFNTKCNWERERMRNKRKEKKEKNKGFFWALFFGWGGDGDHTTKCDDENDTVNNGIDSDGHAMDNEEQERAIREFARNNLLHALQAERNNDNELELACNNVFPHLFLLRFHQQSRWGIDLHGMIHTIKRGLERMVLTHGRNAASPWIRMVAGSVTTRDFDFLDKGFRFSLPLR
jgi:hypothetical protein